MTMLRRITRTCTRSGVPVSIYSLSAGGCLYVPLVSAWRAGYASILEQTLSEASSGSRAPGGASINGRPPP